MSRDCGQCGAAGIISRHDRGITTVWCTTWGEIRRSDDPGCRMYVRGPAGHFANFDVNQNIAIMEKRAQGKAPLFGEAHRAPRPIDLTKLRARSAARTVA